MQYFPGAVSSVGIFDLASMGAQPFEPARPVLLDALLTAADTRMYEQKKRSKQAQVISALD